MANIMIVDDEKEILDLVAVYLENAGHKAFKYAEPNRALEGAQGMDLAILDVMMPGMDGFELCRKLRGLGHTCPIIMLTARDADTDKINGLALGADDYIAKPFNPLELIARVNAHIRRTTQYAAGNAMAQLAGEYDINGLIINEGSHRCTLYGKDIDLTPTEFDILLLLCRQRGKVISSEDIFEQVWGERYYENNNTVMVHIQKLRKKLADTGKKKKFIQTVWGVGYRIDE